MSSKMTLTMDFKRDVPDDRKDLLLTVHAADLADAFRRVDEHLRSRIKYGALGEEAVNELDAARDHLRSELGHLSDPVFG